MNTKQVRSTYPTSAFRLSYPALFEAQEQLGDGDKKVLKYSATMLFPNDQKANELKAINHPASKYISTDNCRGFYQEILKVARANFGPEVDLATLKLPKFRNGDKPKQSGKSDENEHGYIIVRTTSKDRPDVTRKDKTHVTDPGEVYAGCWVRAVLTIAPFIHMKNGSILSRGVTVYLIGVQKVADDAAFSSRPRIEDVFDEIVTDETTLKGNAEIPISASVTTLTARQKDPWEV